MKTVRQLQTKLLSEVEINFSTAFFIFDGDPIDEINESDSYYEKYHYHVAGYGIFVDKEYNVEYGYYTTAPPPSGHGAGYTTFHYFKDAREDDFIRDKLIESINGADIWK